MAISLLEPVFERLYGKIRQNWYLLVRHRRTMPTSPATKSLPRWYTLTSLALTALTFILFLNLIGLLGRDGIVSDVSNIILWMAVSLVVLSPFEAEVHERLHRWGFICAGVSPEKVQVLRPLWRSLLGRGGDPSRRWWCTVVTDVVDGRTYRRGLSASLWMLPIGALVGGLVFGLLDRASWQLATSLGAGAGAALLGLGTLHDVYQIVWSLGQPPSTLFRVNLPPGPGEDEAHNPDQQ